MKGKTFITAWIVLVAVLLTAGSAGSAEKKISPKKGAAHKNKALVEASNRDNGKDEEMKCMKGMNMEMKGPDMPMGMPCMQGKMGPGGAGQGPDDRDPIEMMLDNKKIVIDLGLADSQIIKLKRISSESKKAMIMARAELQIAQIDLEDALEADSPNVGYLDSKIEEVGKKRIETEKIAMHAELDAKAVMTKEQIAKAKELMAQFQPPMQEGNNRPCENCPMMKRDGMGPMGPGMDMGPMRLGMGMEPMGPGMSMSPDMGPCMKGGDGPVGNEGMRRPRTMDRVDGCPCKDCPCMKDCGDGQEMCPRMMNRGDGQDMKCRKMMEHGNNQDSKMDMKDSDESEPCPFHKDGGKKFKLGKGEDQ